MIFYHPHYFEYVSDWFVNQSLFPLEMMIPPVRRRGRNILITNFLNYYTMAKEKKKELPKLEELGTIEKIEVPVVKTLEDNSKCGFYVEKLRLNDAATDLVRLRCESKDAESEDFTLCPWIPYQDLTQMLYGCLYLHPAIINTIKQVQANAEKPAE